ncbi:MAG: 30S ribosomal protein S3, partial [Saccharopolyspora sp.]|nr:30S ribosomal protein S3 [Saccharopolyspora sp.]
RKALTEAGRAAKGGSAESPEQAQTAGDAATANAPAVAEPQADQKTEG